MNTSGSHYRNLLSERGWSLRYPAQHYPNVNIIELLMLMSI